MRVLLVEPYCTGSHRAWADGYVRHSAHDVRLITHPGRWWKWRMRGAAITLAASLETLDGWRPDAVMVSDMVDLAHFRTFARPWIGDVPMALYFHESQLTYPDPPGAPSDDSYALTNWISALSADRVFFNSGYHREVFFQSLPRLLRRFPDHRLDHLISEVKNRSEVLPVGVDLSWITDRSSRNGLRGSFGITAGSTTKTPPPSQKPSNIWQRQTATSSWYCSDHGRRGCPKSCSA